MFLFHCGCANVIHNSKCAGMGVTHTKGAEQVGEDRNKECKVTHEFI